jgi:hypothetical protein
VPELSISNTLKESGLAVILVNRKYLMPSAHISGIGRESKKGHILFKRFLLDKIPMIRYQNCRLLEVRHLLKPKDLENMGKAIGEIGSGKTCITEPVIKAVKKIVMENGMDAAELYAGQLTGTDENTELLRVLKVCRKYSLPPEAISQILDKLTVIESGKW